MELINVLPYVQWSPGGEGERMALETFIEGDGDAGPGRLMLRGKLGFRDRPPCR